MRDGRARERGEQAGSERNSGCGEHRRIERRPERARPRHYHNAFRADTE
jgi:hypothetical protein